MRRAAHLFVPAVLFSMGLALVASAGRQEMALLPRPLNQLPLTLAGATGEERQLTENERTVVGVSDYVFRLFKLDSASMFSVYVGYYQSQATGKTIHSPRNCLPGAGWQVVESGVANVGDAGGKAAVNQYVIANGPLQAVVLYWYQGRGRVASSEYRVKWELLRDAATRGRTEEALVRVMVPIAPSRKFNATDWAERRAEAERLAHKVAAELIPMMDRALPRWERLT